MGLILTDFQFLWGILRVILCLAIRLLCPQLARLARHVINEKIY